jgi:hypothetical protein
MTRAIASAAAALLAFGAAGDGPPQPATRPDYPFKPVPFTRVQLTDEFWAPRSPGCHPTRRRQRSAAAPREY